MVKTMGIENKANDKATKDAVGKKRAQIRRDNVKKLYIKVAERIIRNEGINALNIRRVATDVGYNSATLYSYFEDIDELILFATFKFRKELLADYSRKISTDMNVLEQYVKMYDVYCDHAFKYPEIYFNMYYGKYSYRLDAVLKEYYRIFPEEFPPQTDLIRMFITHADVYEGERCGLRLLVDAGYIKEENIEMVADTVSRVHAMYMHDLRIRPRQEISPYKEKFMKSLRHILDTN